MLEITEIEAIEQFENRLRWAGQNRYPYISKQLQESYKIGISAIKKLSEIKNIIECPIYKEDILRYKAICEVINKGDIYYD